MGAVALASDAARAQVREEGARTFTILHTNDFDGRHSAIDVMPGDATAQTGDAGRDHVEFDRAGRIGGFPVLAAAIAARRAALGSDRVLLPELRRRVEAVVVVSHQGSKADRKMLREVDGIDVVIGAHSHDLIVPPERVGGGWLAQALSDGTMLGEVNVTLRDGKVMAMTGEAHALWADRFTEDDRLAALLVTLRTPHRAMLDEVIGVAADRIGQQYKSESPFDKLVGRILRTETGADIAFLPGVGYGVLLNPGPITREALATLLPHTPGIVTLSLTGAQIMELLEQSAANQAPTDDMDGVGGLIQTDGLQWAADLRQPVGARVGPVRMDGQPLDPAREYCAVTHVGLLGGLHRYRTFAAGRDIQRQDRSVGEDVVASFRTAGVVRAPAVGDVQLLRAGKL